MIITMPKIDREEAINPPMDLWDFAKEVSYGVWEPVPHLNLLIEFLYYAWNGQLENFACALSPRLGKSMTVSETFPAYILGFRPYAKIIHVSYSEDLARSFGEKAKTNFENFGHLFPTKPELSESTKSKSWFKVKKNTGEYFCAGSGGGILGRGGNWIIVDDPTKNIEEARSKAHQRKLIDLFDTTITTRKEKDPVTGQNAVTLVIHQRLDRDDLIGMILKNRKWITAEEALPRLRRGEKLGSIWVYLRLPELAEEDDILGREPGEALWPEKRSREELEEIQSDIGDYKFSAVHLQNPKKREGNIFLPEWFLDDRGEPLPEILTNDENLPEDPNEVRYWDFAASGPKGDATCGLKTTWHDEDMIINGMVHGKFSSSAVLNRFESTTVKDGKRVKSLIEQEPGGMAKLLIKKFRRLNKLRGHSIKRDKVGINKLDRCFDLEILAETGRLKFNTDHLTMKQIKIICNELIAFTGEPGGEDNIVDCCSGSARHWMRPRRKVNV